MNKTLLTLALALAIFASIAFAQDESANSNAPAPVDKKGIFLGNMNGVHISIPERYRASFVNHSLQQLGNGLSKLCKPGIDDHLFECPFSVIEVALRYNNLQPILSHSDFLDWTGHFMQGTRAYSPEHRWIGLVFNAELFKKTQGDITTLFQTQKEEARIRLGIQTCEIKNGMTHCFSPEDSKTPLPNEFYLDSSGNGRMIQCTNLPSTQYGKFFSCTEYFSIPEIKAYAEIGSVTIDPDNSAVNKDLDRWRDQESLFRKIAISLKAE